MRPATVDVGPTFTNNTAIVGWGLPSFLSSYRKNYCCGDPVVCGGEGVCRCLKEGRLLEARPDRRRAEINVTRQGGAGTARGTATASAIRTPRRWASWRSTSTRSGRFRRTRRWCWAASRSPRPRKLGRESSPSSSAGGPRAGASSTTTPRADERQGCANRGLDRPRGPLISSRSFPGRSAAW